MQLSRRRRRPSRYDNVVCCSEDELLPLDGIGFLFLSREYRSKEVSKWVKERLDWTTASAEPDTTKKEDLAWTHFKKVR